MQTSADLTDRRNRVAAEWDLSRGVVLVPAGVHVPVQGTDGFHEFHAHPEFTYLSGARLPGGLLAFDHNDGWVLFAPEAGLGSAGLGDLLESESA